MIAENVAKYAYKTGDAIQDAAKIGKIVGITLATLSTGNLTASQFAANNAVDHNFLGVRQRVLSVASTITIDMLKDPLKRQIILSALASGGAFVWQKIMTVLGINQSGDQFTYDGKAFDTLSDAFADSCAKHNITPEFVNQMMDIVISKPTIHVTPKVENEGLKIESFPVEEPDKEPLMEGYYCPENPLEQEGFDVYDGEKITIFTSEEHSLRIDPKTGKGPMGIDMTGMKPVNGTTKLGYPRNAQGFWEKWMETYPGKLSDENLGAIGKREAPVVDSDWIKHFPEHKKFLGENIEHHHLDHGAIAYPLPEKLHRGAGNYKVWHQNDK
ncbi:MAG: hypothetical protein HEEMFOPI_01761 [Holosporales bacterium]